VTFNRPGFTAAGTVREFHPVPYYALFQVLKQGLLHTGKYTSLKEHTSKDEKKIFTTLRTLFL